jgi:hypothetical protein
VCKNFIFFVDEIRSVCFVADSQLAVMILGLEQW